MRRRRFALACLALPALATAAAPPARAAEVRVAVAANFTDAAKDIAASFEQATGHRVVYSFGSTGQLYTQITQSAPFEVFLAADQERPAKAIEAGHGVPGTRFTYATGRLVLYSRDAGRVTGPEVLREGAFTRLAIANPATAPYGTAALETLAAMGVQEALAARLVRGNNIAQAYQFVATGNAELGFVALSQVIGHPQGSRWIVPPSLHRPIAQDAVLLQAGAGNPAARAYLAFLRGPRASEIKARFGYDSGE